MNLSNVYNLYKAMEEENILLSFKGVITSDLLTSILQIMESKMDYLEESTKTKKKVFNVLVECLQNLYHHGENHTHKFKEQTFKEQKSALFLISKDDKFFQIRTGNYIDKENVQELTDKLEKINGMDKYELKHYYKEVLTNGDVSGKGTAGLGMIDIARKSGNKLEYRLLEINEKKSFFCLNIKID